MVHLKQKFERNLEKAYLFTETFFHGVFWYSRDIVLTLCSVKIRLLPTHMKSKRFVQAYVTVT